MGSRRRKRREGPKQKGKGKAKAKDSGAVVKEKEKDEKVEEAWLAMLENKSEVESDGAALYPNDISDFDDLFKPESPWKTYQVFLKSAMMISLITKVSQIAPTSKTIL